MNVINKMGFFVFIVLVIILIINNVIISDECEFEKDICNDNFNGKITNKYYDKLQHFNQTIIISNIPEKRIYFFNNEKSKFYNYAHIGDSLYKPKGSLEVHVFRNNKDTVFNISYGCFARFGVLHQRK